MCKNKYKQLLEAKRVNMSCSNFLHWSMCLQKTWPGSLQCAGSLDVTCTRPWGTPSDWWSPAGEGHLSKPGPPPELCRTVDWRTARSKRLSSNGCLTCMLYCCCCCFFVFNTKSKDTQRIMGNLNIVTESTNLQSAFNWNISERQETNQHDKLQSPSINEIKLFTWNVSSVLWIYLAYP